MATEIKGLLEDDLKTLITSSTVLVVGAGGIGCELLKNLVLSGFPNIHVIDLDTIEVSNLNRQFLFRREHVGRPKSIVAKESVEAYNPSAKITAYHDSITESKYDINFYKQFTLVTNALDNRAARSHVNRMCLAANIPLIESGSAGYRGHVTLHLKGVSECFDCTPREHQRTFPGCTIRNTPSEPIHCIVWAKHLFNQLFGFDDPDEDVSPDSADPEAVGKAGRSALEARENENRVSTRQWAQSHNYDFRKLFVKLFNQDIKYLLSMENLWLKRRPPTPLEWDDLPDQIADSSNAASNSDSDLDDQRLWSVKECSKKFNESCCVLKQRVLDAPEGEKNLIWDKDDDAAMDFVTACANIRSFIFGITEKSRFDVKSMAGNIIPAIASTNAIVAGLIVMMAFKVLRKDYIKCDTLYVNNRVNIRKELFARDRICTPRSNCYVCSEKPELNVKMDLEKMTIRILDERILKKELIMIAPDVEIDDGQGTILISSEEGETEDIADKLLKDFNVKDGTRLICDDFLQNYKLIITIISMDDTLREKPEIFEIVGDRSKLVPQEIKKEENNKEAFRTNEEKVTNGSGTGSGENKKVDREHEVSYVEEEDELQIIEQEQDDVQYVESPLKKRKLDEPVPAELSSKKQKTEDIIEMIEID